MDLIAEVEKVAQERIESQKPIWANLGIGGYHGNQPPREVTRTIRKYAGSSLLSEYPGPKGMPGVCKSLVGYQQRSLSVDLGEFDASATAGGRDALFLLMLLLLKPGDKVGMPMPGYGGQLAAVQNAGGIPVPIRCGPGFSFVDGVRQALTQGHKLRVILFDNINNPSGEMLSLSDLEELADIAASPSVDAWLVEDGVYREIVLDGDPAPSMLQVKRAHSRLFVVSSGSKNYGIAGLRIGGVVALAKSIQDFVSLKRKPNYGPCVLAQLAYEVALDKCDYYIAKKRQEMRERRNFICSVFPKLGWNVRYTKAGIFILTELPEGQMDALSFAKRLVEKAGWTVYPGPAFAFGDDSPEFDNTVRIAMMEPVKRMRSGLPAIQGFMQSLGFTTALDESDLEVARPEPCIL